MPEKNLMVILISNSQNGIKLTRKNKYRVSVKMPSILMLNLSADIILGSSICNVSNKDNNFSIRDKIMYYNLKVQVMW